MSFRRSPSLLYENKVFSNGYKVIAGIDEAGRGPLAGPVVAAAVILNNYRFKNRIDDCKRLTPEGRLHAYSEILEKSIYSVAVISQNVIDHINIYNATKLAMEKAIIGLDIRPDYALIDGRIKLSLPCKSRSITQGDRKCLSIACASIIAKVRRDRIMTRLHMIYPRYGFINHKGYGTAVHFKTLKKYGPSPVHRLSYTPVTTARRYKTI